MTNIILCGLPGVGKTSIATALAKKLGWQHIDTDECLANFYCQHFNEKLSVRQIYRKLGEKVFRQLEAQVITVFWALKDALSPLGVVHLMILKMCFYLNK